MKPNYTADVVVHAKAMSTSVPLSRQPRRPCTEESPHHPLIHCAVVLKEIFCIVQWQEIEIFVYLKFLFTCSFPHWKGTQRDPEKQHKRANSQQRDNSQQRCVRKADKSESAQKTKPPTKENHFLELKEMLEQMTNRIQVMESKFVSGYQALPNLPSVPHHSFMSPPHNMLPPSHPMHAVPPAFFTPQFSS